ncbi:MAG TPA: serine/threonine protein kinase [Stellaceae bacterium]|nr:serine/threonine protein kinase [Stellaceae bacterium]
MADQQAEAGGGSKAPIRLGERFEIYPDRPLPELRSPNAAGFVAVDRDRPTASLFALICDPDQPPRHEVLAALHGLRSEALLVPHDWGVIEWPATGRRNFGIIFDRPTGGRIVQTMTQTIPPTHEDELIHHLLPSLVASLRELFSAGFTHRAIRPTNLFWRDAAHRALVFGECVSAPPAVLQPVACETIESAMAMPAGRGNGTPTEDLYALGVTLIFLLFGRNLVAALSDDQLLAEKIGRGSYYALLRGERLGGAIVEALRGLLTDDPRERWNVQDLEMWLEGRRLSPKQPALVKRAARPFEFAGHPFYTARSLAYGFSRDPASAVRTLKGPEFEIWMQRSLCDEERSKMLAAALVEGHDVGLTGHDERLVARVCIALDPAAPVRYKGFAAAIDGFGTALVAAFRGRGSVQQIAEAMGGRLPQFWFSGQAGLKPEMVPILKNFERLRLHLEDRRPGFGIERIAYEMNPVLHCLSPAIESEYVMEAGEVLTALERVSEKRGDDDFQVDRHLAAFIAARYRSAGSDWIDALHSPDLSQRVLGALYLLARLQSFKGPPAVPALAKRLGRQLAMVIDRYHSRSRRKRLNAEMPKIVAKGNLGDILTFVDNAADRVRDLQGFQQALRDYATIDRELDLLHLDAPRRPEKAAELGARYAAATASFLAWIVGLSVIVMMS